MNCLTFAFCLFIYYAICFYISYKIRRYNTEELLKEKAKTLKQKEDLLREDKALKEKIAILSKIVSDINRINKKNGI